MSFFHPYFFIKTALYSLWPGGFGYYRSLKRHRNPHYNHERDKHPVRIRHNRTTGWKPEGGPLRQREYHNYDEYVTHQVQKYREILQAHGGFPNYTILSWRYKFFRRFKHLVPRLRPHATILCLGARQGTEVEVLWDLGFRKAYGIDLNPGPDNPSVRPGDFMHLTENDASVDALYTNCIDHVFDLDRFMRENVRILTTKGYGLYDLPRYSHQHEPGAFESIGWSDPKAIFATIKQYFHDVIIEQTEARWKWILVHNPRQDRLT